MFGIGKWMAMVTVLLLCFGATRTARADSVINVVKTSSLSVSIKTTEHPDATGHFAAGKKGLLEITHARQNYVWKQIDRNDKKIDVPLDNIVVAPSGEPSTPTDSFFKVTGGTYTVPKESAIKLKSCGASIVIPAGSVINLNLQNALSVNFSGTGTKPTSLPVAGTQITVSSLTIEKKGVSANGTLTMTGVDLPGVSIVNAAFDWALTATKETDPDSLFSVKQSAGGSSIDIAIDLPGISGTESNPCTLKVTGFRLNEDGDPTFTTGTLVTPPSGLRIPLANPANFALVFTGGAVTMQDGELESANITGGLELPPDFSLAGSSAPVVLPIVITYESAPPETLATLTPSVAKKKLKLLYKIPSPIKAKFGGFIFEIEANQSAVDLDKTEAFDVSDLTAGSPALNPSWMGIVVKSATLTFPDEFGKDSKVVMTNALIGPGGLSGTFSASNFKVPYFKDSQLTSLSGTFVQGRLTACSGKGKIHVSELQTDLWIGVSVTGSGAFTVTADQGQPINMPAFGNKVSLQVDHGTFAYNSTKKAGELSLAGSMTFDDSVPSIGGTTLGFQNLTVSTSGHLSLNGGYVDLPNPVKVPLGPVSVTLEQFGLVTHVDGSYSTPAIKLTGSVSVADDLPINGSIGFDGLTIYESAASKLNVDWDAISLDLSIDKVGSLTAEIHKGEFPDAPYRTFLEANPGVASPWRNSGNAQTPYKTVPWLTGKGRLTLDCLKAGAIEIDFTAAPKSWFVAAKVDLSNGIRLGSSGLSLFGFEGGLGRNVSSYSGDSGMVGVPISGDVAAVASVSRAGYTLIPIPPDIPAGYKNWDKKWLFMAGVTIGTDDKYSAWGDVVLTASLGSSSFFIDLDGMFYILQEFSQSTRDNPDRYAHINLHYDSETERFTAKATADLYFPNKSSNFLHAYAPVDLLISPHERHFYIGGDVTENPGNAPTMEDPAIVTLTPFSGKAVLKMDFPDSHGAYVFKAGGIIGASLSFGTDLGWCKLSGGLSADAYFYLGAKLDTPSSGARLSFVSADGQVGLEASLWGDAKIGKLGWGFSASGHADLTAHLDSNYKLSGQGTLSGHVKFGRFNKGFSNAFTF